LQQYALPYQCLVGHEELRNNFTLSSRPRFFTWINFNSIAFVSLSWTSTATSFSVKPLEFFDHSVLQKHTDKEFIMN